MRGGPTLQALVAKTEKSLKALDEKELGKILDEVVTRTDQYKSQVLVRPWLRSLAFFLGYQHIMWSSKFRRFFPMPLKAEERHTVNLYRSRVMSMASSFSSHRPKFSVIPEEASSQSRADARPADLILANLWNESKFTSRNTLGALHRALFGGVFWETWYDDQAGPVQKEYEYAIGPDLMPILDQNGQPIPLTDKSGTKLFNWSNPVGEVRADIRSMFEVGWPQSSHEPIVSELPWIFTRTPVSVHELKARWGLTVAPQPEAVDPLQVLQFGVSADLGRYLEPQTLLEAIRTWEGEECAWETRFYTPHFSENGWEGGKMFVLVDGKAVHRGEGPLETGELPFEYQPNIPIPCRLAAETAAFDMQDPQMQLNWALADIATIRRAASTPYVFYPKGSILEADILSGKRFIERRGMDMSAIQVVESARLNQAVVAEVQAHSANIDRTASQHSFTRGEMSGASPQPVGTVQRMQAADVGDLQPGMDISDEAQGSLGRKMLTLVRQHYNTERLAMVTSDEVGDVAGFMYSRSTLPQRLRVVIRPKSSITDTNKDALRTQFAEIAKSGILGPITQDPKFQEYLLELYDAPAPEQLLTVSNLSWRRQEREIEEMIAIQQPLPLGPRDEHEAHRAVIARLTNTGRWDTLSEEAKAAILQHDEMHGQALQQAMMQQFQQQMAMQQMQMAGGLGVPTPNAPQETPTGAPIR